MFTRQHQTHSTTREILQCSPSVRFDEQSLPRMIEQDGRTLFPIVKVHDETATHCHHQLVKIFVRMTSTTLTARHIVSPIDALDVERHILHLLCHSQIATRVNNLWQLNDFVVKFLHSQSFVYTLPSTTWECLSLHRCPPNQIPRTI